MAEVVLPLTSSEPLEQLFQHRFQSSRRVACTFLDGSGRPQRQLTYRELGERIVEVAGRLQGYVRQGDRVLLAFPLGLDFEIGFLACLHAGAIAVPVCPPRNRSDQQRFLAIVENAKPALILTIASVAKRLKLLPEVATQRFYCTDSPRYDGPSRWRLPRIVGDQAAVLQYTSGSTSNPRGVVITWTNLLHNVRNMQERVHLEEDEVIVSWLPFFHDMGLMAGLLLPIHTGCSSYYLSPAAFLRRPETWLKAISKFRAVASGGPNFAYDHCLRSIPSKQRNTFDLTSWRFAMSGGEPIRAGTLDRFAAGFSASGFRAQSLSPCYGLAEATLMVSGVPFDAKPRRFFLDRTALEDGRLVEVDPDDERARTLVGSGRPASGVEIRIVDPETRTPCPNDRIGEIWIAGPAVANGYWERPEETARNFHAKLAETDTGSFLRTGDLGFLQDGELVVAGRLKDLIIIRGSNLYPEDLEETLATSHPLVSCDGGAAFAIEDDAGERLVMVAEVEREFRPDDLDQVAEAIVSAIVEGHGVRPHIITIIRRHSLPRTSSFKVQRRETRQRWLDGELSILAQWSDDESEARTEGGAINRASVVEIFRPPKAPNSAEVGRASPPEAEALPRDLSGIEQWLVDQLAKRRRLKPELVDPEAPLSRFGIDSLEAMEFLRELEERFDKSAELETLVGPLTIRALAELLSDDEQESTAASESMALAAPASPKSAREEARAAPSARAVRHSPQTWSTRLSKLSERYVAEKSAGRYLYQRPVSASQGAWVEVGGRRMLMLASYGYLGLLGHPRINAAAQEAAEILGTGSHGVPLLAGTTSAHTELERTIAAFKGAEDAMVFSSGYVTNITTLSTLPGPDTILICDQLNHASIIDGCRLSEASLLMFEHNSLEDLERVLELAGNAQKLVVVDAVFSMDGDVAPLPEIARLCRQCGALLMVDEAHSLGVLGETGRGIEEEFSLPYDTIDVKMGTLSKTIPSTGGYISGSAELIAALKHNSRAFIFSAALAPPQAAAARAALEVILEEPERVATLRRQAAKFRAGAQELGFDTLQSKTAIVPIICETEDQAIMMAMRCDELGVFTVPVVYPAVPLGLPRLRTTVTAAHSDNDIDFALAVLGQAGRACGVIA